MDNGFAEKYSPSANYCTWVGIRNNQLPEDQIGEQQAI